MTARPRIHRRCIAEPSPLISTDDRGASCDKSPENQLTTREVPPALHTLQHKTSNEPHAGTGLRFWLIFAALMMGTFCGVLDMVSTTHHRRRKNVLLTRVPSPTVLA